MASLKKEIMISVSSTETRIALLEDENLVELYFESPEEERMVGDIYKGRVENVVEAVKAAFVNIGLKQNGFLSFSDLGEKVIEYSALAETLESERKSNRKYGHRQEGIYLKPGQEILVQVIKEPMGTKGARLTTAISLPGRFLVLVPNSETIGISRKIENRQERFRLRKLAEALCPPGFGLIIRTVASGKDMETLKNDLDNLLETWRTIEHRAQTEKAPKLIHKEMGLTASVIRDLFSPDIDRLVVDSKRLYGEIKEYLAEVAPGLLSRVELYRDDIPLFDRYKIEEQIERSLSRKIWLKRGGYICFDQVEAMTVIDVNSGRSVGHRDHELNAYETDLEAAREIARQLRLRDIGGIIVIDFIDLKTEKYKRRLVAELKKAFSKDRAVCDVLPMNAFGLVALTRERVRPSLFIRYSEPCPRCDGLGRVPSKSLLMTRLENRLRQLKSETGERRFVLHVHPHFAMYLKKGIPSRIQHLMAKYFVLIKIHADATRKEDEFELKTYREEKKKWNSIFQKIGSVFTKNKVMESDSYQ